MTDDSTATGHPSASPETREFWDALQSDGALLLRECQACGRLHFYPRGLCPFCGSTRLAWQAASGAGTVYTFSVMRRVEPTYCIAIVEVAPEVQMMTNIVNSDLDEIRIGSTVALDVSYDAQGFAMPTFRLVKGSHAS